MGRATRPGLTPHPAVGAPAAHAPGELADLTVLHVDKDFDLIAGVTGQPTQRLEPG